MHLITLFEHKLVLLNLFLPCTNLTQSSMWPTEAALWLCDDYTTQLSTTMGTYLFYVIYPLVVTRD